jgi:hypothetical protein
MTNRLGRFTHRIVTIFDATSTAEPRLEPTVRAPAKGIDMPPKKRPATGMTPPPMAKGNLAPRRASEEVSRWVSKARDLLPSKPGTTLLRQAGEAGDAASVLWISEDATPRRSDDDEQLGPPAYEAPRVPDHAIAGPRGAHLQVPPREVSLKAMMRPPPYTEVDLGAPATVRSATGGLHGPEPARDLPPQPAHGGLGHLRNMTDFLRSGGTMESALRPAIFNEGFQDHTGWVSFLGRHLAGSSIIQQFREPAEKWTHHTFQAMFMAAWLSHPTEKGSYVIDLSSLTDAQRAAVKQAWERNCDPRKSSHFSGVGGSASRGRTAFKGYDELLVQLETIAGRPCLFLKMEGHKTDLKGIYGHGRSWLQKIRTGEGLTASPAMKALAEAAPGLIEPRAAENYTKDYKSLLKHLGLAGKLVPAREMAAALFAQSGYLPSDVPDLLEASNEEVGRALARYVLAARRPLSGEYIRMHGVVTDPMLKDIGKLADSLIADGGVQRSRVHREVVRNPAELDRTRDELLGVYHSPGNAGGPATSPALARHGSRGDGGNRPNRPPEAPVPGSPRHPGSR